VKASNIGDEFDIWVSASFDGGTTWNGASDGTGKPFRANVDNGTHYFPAVAAGAPGKIVVAYLSSKTLVGTRPNGKPDPTTDQDAKWNVYLSQSLNLRAAKPKFTSVRVSTKPMHVGDVCTLGLACAGFPGTDRNLLDFIDVQVAPRGLAHVVYTDDHNYEGGAMVAGNQVRGPSSDIGTCRLSHLQANAPTHGYRRRKLGSGRAPRAEVTNPSSLICFGSGGL
jgi:hypothetical protein